MKTTGALIECPLNQLPKKATYLGSDWQNSKVVDSALLGKLASCKQAYACRINHPDQWEIRYFGEING